MTEHVLVTVAGRQTMDGETVLTPELVTTGTYSRDALAHRVAYDETAGEDGTLTQNELLFTSETAELKKEGEVQAHLIFQAGRKNLTVYETPYGSIPMEMQTHAVDVRLEEEEIALRLTYSMCMDEKAFSEFDLDIRITPNEGN